MPALELAKICLACLGAILGLLERLQLKLTIYFNKFKSSWVLLGGRTNFFLCQLRDGWVLRNNQQITTRFTKSSECDQYRRRWLFGGCRLFPDCDKRKKQKCDQVSKKKIFVKKFRNFFLWMKRKLKTSFVRTNHSFLILGGIFLNERNEPVVKIHNRWSSWRIF